MRNGKFDVGIADDQARDFDFVAAEMKYDSTGMFHWTPSRPIEDCIQVIFQHSTWHKNFLWKETQNNLRGIISFTDEV